MTCSFVALCRVTSIRTARFGADSKEKPSDTDGNRAAEIVLASRLPVSSPARRQRLRQHFGDVYNTLCARAGTGEVLPKEKFKETWMACGLPASFVEHTTVATPRPTERYDGVVWALLDPRDTGAVLVLP